MSIIDNVFGFFVEEATDHLQTLEEGLLQLERDPSRAESQIEPLFRAAHTLKGSANLVNVTDVGTVAHRLEDLLEEIRDAEKRPTKLRIDAMLFALDQIREMIHCRKHGQNPPENLLTETLSQLALAGQKSAEDKVPLQTNQAIAVESPESQQEEEEDEQYVGAERRSPGRRVDEAGVVRVGLDKIEALMGLVGQFTVTKNHLLNRLPVLEQMRSEIDFAGQRLLKEVTGFSEQYDYTLPQQSSFKKDDPFDELEFDRYDELNLFSRKLREITHDVEEALKEMSGFFKGFSRDVQSLDRMNEELKERISAARTVQAGELFQRFNRPVRDMSQELARPVELCISGGDTPIDRVIYDGLFDPLLHIVRNAFAHGIEPSEVRLAQGKPEKARIWLKAERRGNTVEVTVEDDGRGIDLERVRQRAVEKGFVGPQEQLGEAELIQLIFRPGFSTTVTADSKSGRGVGMNVVMDRLASLNGTIEVTTEAGEGASFRLRFPLSLVIVNVIQFVCGGQKMVIPTALVEEIVDLKYTAKHPADETRHESVARVDLAGILQMPVQGEPPGFGIVTQSEGLPLMLLVDTVLGQEDTVIKPFGEFLQELPFFSGSSLAGDGSLRLVINPARMKNYQAPELPADTKASPATESRAKVLIVDDSLSVRKYASLLLAGRGFDVVTAVNGQDALSKLQTETVFSIITDLEMPVMHGYELLRELKVQGYGHIPVAVLTSRAGEQHRKEAMTLGASDYLVKPFEEDGLVSLVERHQQAAWQAQEKES